MNEQIIIKSNEEIDKMRQAGKIAGDIFRDLEKDIKRGITTKEIDELIDKMIIRSDAKPSFKGFHGFPAASCISINDEVVHGIPSDRILKEGDIVGVDLGVYFNGYHADTAKTFAVGRVSVEARKLMEITKVALDKAISMIKPGIHLGDVQFLIQETAEQAGFGVIRDLTGHGIGKDLQEAPPIPNYGKKGEGIVLAEGMVLAIEPMFSVGDWHINVSDDGWTCVTRDHSLAAHFEHTIAVTKNGSEVLTR